MPSTPYSKYPALLLTFMRFLPLTIMESYITGKLRYYRQISVAPDHPEDYIDAAGIMDPAVWRPTAASPLAKLD
jgi:hypothetical protein